MKLGIISLGGDSSKLILEEARNYFSEAQEFDIRKITVNAQSKELNIQYEGKTLKDFDCLYIRGGHKYSLIQRSITKAYYHSCYMPIKAEAFTTANNKFLALLELRQHDATIPNSYFAATTKEAKNLLKQIHFPIIIKVPVGTQGKGVMVADSIASAKSVIDALDTFKQPYILQEYMDTEDEKGGSSDIRAIVIGGKVAASMKRTSEKDDIRANIHAGGTGASYPPSEDVEHLAIKAAKAIGADICGVDILEHGKHPAVIEVNLSPGLKGIQHYTGQNVAREIAKYLYTRATERREAQKTQSNVVTDMLERQTKEHYLTAVIKKGNLVIPPFITKDSGISLDDDLIIKVKKGYILIKEHTITKED